MKRPPLYVAWQNMLNRCRNPNVPAWKNYGGRGIRVCKRWHDFENFAADMGPHPGNGLTLDRKNNEGEYYKRNCRWSTRTTQNRNSRRAKLTLKLVVQLRREYEPGRPYKGSGRQALALKYNIPESTIKKIVRGGTWA